MNVDLTTGKYDGPPTAVKRVGDVFGTSDDRVAYEIYGSPSMDDLDPPKLLHATTVLFPGNVDGRPFMTRGHFHVRPDRGELMVTLAGEGVLLLVNREGEVREEPMARGSIHDVDGTWAHRVVNTGDQPLAFFVAWMSDCGHEYGDIPFPTVPSSYMND